MCVYHVHTNCLISPCLQVVLPTILVISTAHLNISLVITHYAFIKFGFVMEKMTVEMEAMNL